MKTLSHLITLFMFLGFTLNISAQSSDLEHLKPLVGNWSGSGWTRMPDGKIEKFNQTEKIELRLKDNILVINGIGRSAETGEVSFEAIGIVYKEPSGAYKMNAHTQEGGHTIANFTIEPNKFSWWFDVPSGTIKYDAEFTDNTWVEKGNFSPDGQQWYPFFEMTLKKD
ncbi:hypothetical protein [Fulvivirga lutimaris]|uniref:hypothetical protein n=1 Tax=Fulvivirga lutimaris TaxID=1819566 RepID=UPI0012BB9403|nr:hypothetical protein [Fulvivirga lutimaris]MTI39056.1 hypothetical protein [Fulvivirga lutimaris]